MDDDLNTISTHTFTNLLDLKDEIREAVISKIGVSINTLPTFSQNHYSKLPKSRIVRINAKLATNAKKLGKLMKQLALLDMKDLEFNKKETKVEQKGKKLI